MKRGRENRPREKENKKDIAEVKRENHHLKRALARAEKQVQRLLENSALTLEPDPEPTGNVPTAAIVNACPTCEQGTTTVAIGPKTLQACKNCGWRKVVG